MPGNVSHAKNASAPMCSSASARVLEKGELEEALRRRMRTRHSLGLKCCKDRALHHVTGDLDEDVIIIAARHRPCLASSQDTSNVIAVDSRRVSTIAPDVRRPCQNPRN